MLQALADDIGPTLNDAHRGERIRDGSRIAITGLQCRQVRALRTRWPSAKRRSSATSQAHPGRCLRCSWCWRASPSGSLTQAGLREAAAALEAEGVRRALARAEEADLRIGVVEGDETPVNVAVAMLGAGDLLVRSKLDPFMDPPASRRRLRRHAGETPAVHISATTGEGMRDLEALLSQRVTEAPGPRRGAGAHPRTNAIGGVGRGARGASARDPRSILAPNWRPKTCASPPIRSAVWTRNASMGPKICLGEIFSRVLHRQIEDRTKNRM